jgi:pilus assembly protein TadC
VDGLCVVLMGRVEPGSAQRRRRLLLTQVPQALELVAACLAAGMPVRTACRAIVSAFDGPVAEELRRVLSLIDLGVSDAEAWTMLADHPQLGPAAADLARSVESGTRMVEGLRQHAAAAREARRSALQVQARRVGVRSVLPLMTCFIPSFMLIGVVPTVASAVFNALR